MVDIRSRITKRGRRVKDTESTSNEVFQLRRRATKRTTEKKESDDGNREGFGNGNCEL